MSNATLKRRVEEALAAFGRHEVSLSELASAVEVNAEAMEGMPYELIRSARDICRELAMGTDFRAEDFDYDPTHALRGLRAWLDQLPLEV